MSSNKASAIIVFILLVTSIIGSIIIAPHTGAAGPKTLNVPSDYPTISAAVAAATEYDIIIVKEGTYQENPIVDVPLCLKAEGNVTVVGEGGVERGARAVFTINSDDVTLTGFNIQSQHYADNTYFATGINVNGDNVNITGTKIVGTYYGIFSFIQTHCSITGNTITDTKKDGIRIIGGSKNIINYNTIIGNTQSGIAVNGYSDIIFANTITDNNRAIGLGASYSVVSSNVLANNTESGMYIATSNSTIDHNSITGNGWGIYFTSFFAAPNNNTFYSNNFADNVEQVGTDSAHNSQIWDNKATKTGNYWSNYNRLDANNDGVGDVPYRIYIDGINDVDNYPLINPVDLPSTASQPQLPAVPSTVNGLAGMWHFNEVEPNGVTPDALGVNPIMLEPNGNSYTPVLVDGKNEKALRFNGTDYAYVLASPNLDIVDEITIDAWVYVEEFKDIPYNNIVVQCERTPEKYPNRILGLAYNGEVPQKDSSPRIGALRGFILSKDGVFNEIITTDTAIALNQWTHVVFVHSITDGMHIYINGKEQTVQVTSGAQNPTGQAARGNEFYIGHDSVCIIDEVSISTTAVKPEQTQQVPSPTLLATINPSTAPSDTLVWTEWWLLAAIGVVTVLLGVFFIAKHNIGKHLGQQNQ